MENFARELFLFEQRQHNLAHNLGRKQKTAQTIMAFEQQRPAFWVQLLALRHILAQVKKIHIQVSIIVQEPAIEKAGC